MDTTVLLKDELVYELDVRGLSSDGNASTLRKRLNKAMEENQPLNCLPECSEAELNRIDVILSALKVAFESVKSKQASIKISQRLLYVQECLARYVGSQVSISLKKALRVLLNRSLDLEEALMSTLSAEPPADSETSPELDPTSASNSDRPSVEVEKSTPVSRRVGRKQDSPLGNGAQLFAGTNTVLPAKAPAVTQGSVASETSSAAIASDQQDLSLSGSPSLDSDRSMNSSRQVAHRPEEGQHSSKVIPVFKWGLKFSGDGPTSAATFMAKVESMRKARGMSEMELFRSCSDLLEGRARIWFDARQDTFANWSEFKARFLKVFLPVNYQDDLEAEIKNRKQGPSESVELYVASMMELFARLPDPFDDAKKLRTICRNLRLSLQQSLTLSPVNDLETLIEVCGRLEENELRMGVARLPYSGARRLLEPELSGNRFRGPDITPRSREVAAVETFGDAGAKCYNCSQTGHLHRDCREPRRIFCYGCGTSGIKSYQCPRCSAQPTGDSQRRPESGRGPPPQHPREPNTSSAGHPRTTYGAGNNDRRRGGRLESHHQADRNVPNNEQGVGNGQRPAQSGAQPAAAQ